MEIKDNKEVVFKVIDIYTEKEKKFKILLTNVKKFTFGIDTLELKTTTETIEFFYRNVYEIKAGIYGKDIINQICASINIKYITLFNNLLEDEALIEIVQYADQQGILFEDQDQ